MADRLSQALHFALYKAPRPSIAPQPSLVHHGDTAVLSYRHSAACPFTAELRHELDILGLELAQPSTDADLEQRFHSALFMAPCNCRGALEPFLVPAEGDAVLLSYEHHLACQLIAKLRSEGIDVAVPEHAPAPKPIPARRVKLTENELHAVRLRSSTVLRIKTALEIGEIDEDYLRLWAQELDGGMLPGSLGRGKINVRAEVDALARSLRDWNIQDARPHARYLYDALERVLAGDTPAPSTALEREEARAGRGAAPAPRAARKPAYPDHRSLLDGGRTESDAR
jgi:hypothetical protein